MRGCPRVSQDLNNILGIMISQKSRNLSIGSYVGTFSGSLITPDKTWKPVTG